MDPAITSGLNMTVVGLTTVFAALGLLLAVVTVTSRILDRIDSSPAEPVSTSGHDPADRKRRERADYEARARVAAAAYAFHCAHRVHIQWPASASPWLRAGRQEQVDHNS